MPFEKGKPRATGAGRKPGVPNKRTQSLIEVLNQHDYSPVADLIQYSQMAKMEIENSSLPDVKAAWVKIGVSCATGLLPYVYPKRKPSEKDEPLDEETLAKLNTDDLIKMAEQAISELKQ